MAISYVNAIKLEILDYTQPLTKVLYNLYFYCLGAQGTNKNQNIKLVCKLFSIFHVNIRIEFRVQIKIISKCDRI